MHKVITLLSSIFKMKTKQTIIIIGAGGIMGAEIAKDLSKGNYRLLLNDKSAGRLTGVLDEILEANPFADAEIMDCSFEGCWEADIIILTVPPLEEEEVASIIKEVANQKIVVSFSNRSNENQNSVEDCEVTAGKALQEVLPHSKIIKVFNIVTLEELKITSKGNTKRDIRIMGDDKEALDTIHELFQTTNLYPIKTNEKIN